MTSTPTKSVASVWDNFDVSNLLNAGFKLEFVPNFQDNKEIGEIDEDDISSEIKY